MLLINESTDIGIPIHLTIYFSTMFRILSTYNPLCAHTNQGTQLRLTWCRVQASTVVPWPQVQVCFRFESWLCHICLCMLTVSQSCLYSNEIKTVDAKKKKDWSSDLFLFLCFLFVQDKVRWYRYGNQDQTRVVLTCNCLLTSCTLICSIQYHWGGRLGFHLHC